MLKQAVFSLAKKNAVFVQTESQACAPEFKKRQIDVWREFASASYQ